jgi:CelD/BcsL family acetyltransferase involved in cellulose biosynthesis
MSWKFQPAVREFPDFAKEWDALNEEQGNHILLDSGFVAPLLRHFGNENVLLAVNSDTNQRGMALLSQAGTGRWETFQPSQAPIGLIAFGRVDEAGEGLVELTRKLPGHALQLSVMQQDPDYSCFPLQNTEGRFERVDYIQTARITLNGTFEDYWKARGTNLRHNLARRRRRLGEKGYSMELVEVRRPDEVAAAIREFGLLESKGWKGREGTAVTEENAQGRFYREMLEYFCGRGEAVIYQLRFDGKVVASDLCVLRGGMIVILKTAYDEELNDFSPAFLMREEAMKKFYSGQGLRAIEFYGRVMEWHTRWSEEIRTLYHINCLRHAWVDPLKKLAGRFS